MSDQEPFPLVEGDVLLKGGSTGVLLIHGLGGTPAEVRFVAQGLNREGFTVLCPLLRGHGGSDLLLNSTTWHDWRRSVEDAFVRLKERCDTVIIAGQSAGAMLAINLTANHQDDIEGLVLFSPTFWPNGWAIPWYFNFFRLVQQRWLANLFHFRERSPYGLKDERIRKFVLESIQQDGRSLEDIFGRRGGTVVEFMRLARRARQRIRLITKPTLVIHSRQDDQAHLNNALTAVNRISGRVELLVLDDSYHLVTLDRQRNMVVERAKEFMHRLAGAAAVRKPTVAKPALREVSAND